MAAHSNTENGWTSEIQDQLKYIGECAHGYTRMYKMDIEKYSSFQQKWTNGNISAGILGGSLLTLSLGLGLENSQAMVIVSAFISFATSFFQGYLHRVDYATIIADLKRQAAKYSNLQNNIKRQLSLPQHLREKAKDYHYWITSSYDQLGELSMNISSSTIEKYRKICEKEKIAFPDEGDIKVVVHVDSPQPEVSAPRAEVSASVPKPVPSTPPLVDIGLQYTDQHMKYELARLAGHSEID